MASATEGFRRQHNELLAIVGEMVPMLKPDALKQDATAVRALLSTLAGKLIVHLSMEDRSMYPRLASHGDATIAATAKKYSDEMGGLKEAFVAYTKRWPAALSIQADPAGFIKDTSGIFAALGNRIERENSELYAIVDRVGM